VAVFILTGKLGAGKTLCAVGKMRDALLENKRVATNIDLWLENLINVDSKRCEVLRLPDKINAEAIDSIGMGSDKFGEEHNGLMVLDEGGLMFNSRDYRQQHIKDFIQWMVHARKKRWDIILIIQHVEALDKQIRDMFGEHLITCLRTDRINIPFLGFILKFLTLGTFETPRLHLAITRYGLTAKDPVTDKDAYRGTTLYDAFDTEQKYDFNEERGTFLYLPPYYTVGRYVSARATLMEKWKTRLANFSKGTIKKRKFFLLTVLIGLLIGRYGLPSIPDTQPTVATESKQKPRDLPSSGFSLTGSAPNSSALESLHPLEGISITGVMESDGKKTYFFQRFGEPVPAPKGYSLVPHSDFSATLIKDNKQYLITSNPFILDEL